MRLDRNEWESVFGDRKNLNLSKSILTQLDAIEDETEIEQTSAAMGDKEKFVWSPPED